MYEIKLSKLNITDNSHIYKNFKESLINSIIISYICDLTLFK